MRLKLLSFTLLLIAATTAFAGGVDGIRFIENKGQWDKKILYRTAIPAGDLFFERTCLTFNLYDYKAVQKAHPSKKDAPQNNLVNFHAFKLNFSGANFWAPTYATDKTDDYYNYYIGNDKNRWASHVNAFKTITYKGIYDNIDLAVKARGQVVKYEFIVAPGASTNNIVLDFDGVSSLRSKDDNLLIETSVMTLQEEKPYAYQTIDGIEIPVECRFVVKGNKVTYAFPNGYDLRYELVIDPNLVFCSFSGSLTDNWGYTATYDQQGNLYAGGIAFDNGYPLTTGSFQQAFGLGSCDATISKYTANGTSFMYSTYLGGNSGDQPQSMIVNNNGELYVFGTTGSTDFPVTTGAYDQTFNGGPAISFDSGFINFTNGADIYIARFKNDGTALLSCTYFGGNNSDGLNPSANLTYNYADDFRGEIFIDSQNNIIIGSSTLSTNLPSTSGSFQSSLGGAQDGCLAKFNSTLTQLQWSSYFGGSQDDAIYSVYVDNTNTIYFTGGTGSQNLPVTNNSIQPVYGGGIVDGFVGHASANGQQLLQSTFYGTSSYDQSYFVQVDQAGHVYIIGQTENTGSSLISNASWNTPGGNQFIAKFNSTLDNVVWSTRFGKAAGLPDIVPSAFLVDVCNKVYVSGWGGDLFGSNVNSALCTGLPVSNNAFQPTTDGKDYYLLIIDDAASSLVYATYFGGPQSEEHVDGGTSRFDRAGVIYQSVCAGCTGLSDFPTTTGAVSEINQSTNCNNGVFKFNFDFPITVANFATPNAGCLPFDAAFTNQSTNAVSYVWDFGDSSPTSTATNPTHTYNSPGTYTITLIAQNPANCNVADTIMHQLILVGTDAITLPDTSVCPGQPVQIGIAPLGDPNVTYAWTPTTGLDNATLPNPTATVSTPTTFTLIVTIGNCVDTFYQTVNISSGLQINAGPDKTICGGSAAAIGFVDNSGTITYQWSPATGLSNASIANPVATPTTTTTYHLTASLTGSSGCTGEDSVTVFVLDAPPTANFELTLMPGCDNLTMQLDNQSDSPAGPFYWNLGNGFIPTNGDTAFLVQYNSTYTISLVVGNAPCSDTLTKTINITDFAGMLNLNNVNVFTPLNGDALNTCFSPALPQNLSGIDPQTYPLLQCSNLVIYNRWGRKIWEGAGCWDGYTEGGNEVTEGVYYYIFEVAGVKKHGTVHVIKNGN